MNIPAMNKQELKRDIPSNQILAWWADDHQPQQPLRVSNAIMTEQKDEPCWQIESRRGRTDGSEPQSHDYREIFITGPVNLIQLSLHPSSQYVIVPPAIEGGLDKLFETIARTQRTRSGFANVSRQQKRQRFSRLFKWVQHEQTEKMRIYANVTRRWVNVLTSSLKAWAPPSWTADVTRSHAGGDIMTASSQNWSYFQNETLCSSWRDWGPRPRRLPDMWHCAITESSGMQNLISELHFNPKVQGLWLQQITD